MKISTPKAPRNSSKPHPSKLPGMGAIPHDRGTDFRVWAPNAAAVHVTGSFNDWADPGLPLAAEGEGIWSASALGVEEGEEYKFRITHGDQVLVKIDPRARVIDPDSHNGVIYRDTFDWEGVEWETPPLNEMVVYELHVGTFGCGKKGGPGTFGEVIRRLPYLKDLGVNVIELMPPTEFPGSTSWGYNPSHPFAVESGYGGPDGLKTLIREAHRQGIAVFLDVVYNHFGPGDLDLWQFDGWSENGMGGIFFYNDWKAETPWGHTRPDYGRHEVRQYLRDNALMWIEEFRADGLRLDAVSYIRRTRGNEHHESVDLPEGWQVLQWINKDLKQHSPRIISVAEDLGNNTALTAWVEEGGAGFDTQWDSSFVHPVRAVLEAPEDDDRDIGALVSAIIPSCEGDSFRRVIYSESHDEVANGRQRLVSEIDPSNPASVWARRRTLQAAGLVLTSPGVPMLFQGQEFLEDGWFDDREALDWEKARRFRGIRLAFRDLIRMRRNLGGITRGLTGQHVDVFHRDAENKVVAWHRWHEGGPRDSTVVILNLSHREHEFYELTLPAAGEWVVRFNADWTGYSSDFGDTDLICVEGREDEVGHPAVIGGLKLPPYALVVLSQD
jgi:1,4-alpha-glucan branching enzyme